MRRSQERLTGPVANHDVPLRLRAWLRSLRARGSTHVQHISVYIARPPAEVYEFASDPRNLPHWAAGLARADVRRDGDEWIADAPFGIHNPMRVVPSGKGSELVFTLIRQPGMTDAHFAKDKAAIANDLKALKDLLERQSSSQ